MSASFKNDILKATKSASMNAAAKVLGLSHTTLFNIEQKKIIPKQKTIDLIKSKTGIDVTLYFPYKKSFFVEREKNNVSDIYKPLRIAIQKAGNRAALSEMSKISKSVISKCMNGYGKLSCTTAQKIANAVGMDVKDFDNLSTLKTAGGDFAKKKNDVFDDEKIPLVRVNYRC